MNAELQESSPPSEPPNVLKAVVGRLPGLVAIVIAVAVVAYFYRVHSPLLTVFTHLFDRARNPYHYIAGTIDWNALGIAGAAALVLILVGYVGLHALDLYIPDLARLPLAYVVGLGVVGILVEVETIFSIHSRESILGTVAVVLLGFAAAAHYRTRQAVLTGPASRWGTWRSEIAKEHDRRYRESLCHPKGPLAIAACGLLLALIAAVTLLTFYHGALCPETYWDSLILYVGYAREIFFRHAFPFKAVAQVGIGLGANYPHLYALMTAATATVAGHWSDSFAQVAPPLAGLLSCLLVYHTVLRVTRHCLLALALTAVFRAIPYGIAYFIYASDYAFVMLFVAAFLYVALCYFETGLMGYFVLATLIPAFAMHLNYLMGLLWIVWAAMLLLAHVRPIRELEAEPADFPDDETRPRDMVALQTVHPRPPTFAQFLRSRRLWTWFVVGVALASPWYIRNWVLTGNPVYAFFQPLFPKTLHYNREVMDSAVVEWTLNGDGIGKASLTRDFLEQYDRFERARDVSSVEIARIRTPLMDKLRASWRFWVSDFNAWKLAPAFLGIALPGLLLFLIGIRRRRDSVLAGRESVARRRFGWLCALLLFLLLIYHYLLADFYLYQIIPLVVLIPLLGAYVVRALGGRLERGLFVILALWITIFPGLALALMGFKIKGAVQFGDRVYSPFDLVALHNVGLDKTTFYQFAFGDDVNEWAALNTYGLDQKTLTHENRGLLLDRRVGIVHFDDWEVQALWRKSPDEQLRGLRDLGIKFYMFVPNETKHQVNRRLGPPARTDVTGKEPKPWQLSALRGWIETSVLEPVGEFGDNRLYRFKYPESAIAPVQPPSP